MEKLTLTELLIKNKLEISPEFNVGFVRVGAQWFKGQSARVGEREIQWAAFGDFARNISLSWDNLDGAANPEEKKKLEEFVRAARQENQKAREEHWKNVQAQVLVEWEDAATSGSSPYLERKGFTPGELFGCRVESHERGNRTLVPARDVDGKLWGYQRIYSEKLSIAGTDKIFREGARKEGCYHLLGAPLLGSGDASQDKALYLVEGIATAASVFTAMNGEHPVVSVFDAGNLVHVARALRKKYPKTPLIFAADHDQFPGRDGKIHHTGRLKAQAAADEVGNAHVILPYFEKGDLAGRPTDYNDLHRLKGIAEVREQLLNPVPLLVDLGPGGALRAVTNRGADGKPKKPVERQIAMALLAHFGPNRVKQGRDLFIYSEGFWQHQDEMGLDRIRQMLARLYGPCATMRDVRGAFDYMMVHCPTVPEGLDLFIPQSFACNFLNGTLHLEPRVGMKPRLDFRPHRREDFVTSRLPFAFPGLDKLTSKNAQFEEMLDRIFRGDKDAAPKKRALAQMFGAVLLPAWPRIFFLVGAPGSGKSTICKILHRLASQQNVCHVDPSHFSGFNMASMVGKLLNLVTDIDTSRPINDSVVKQVCDRLPFRISRKFQTDLLAPLPPIHILGGNDMPVSNEGTTGAYKRRLVILKFGAYRAESQGEGGYALDFADQVWNAGWEGILAFAIAGALDLCELQGHYTIPESSNEILKDWDERSDPLAQFLDAMAHGEVDGTNQYKMGSTHRISSKNLWKIYAAWQDEHLSQKDRRSAKWLGDELRRKGFKRSDIRNERGWEGISVGASPESDV